MNIEIFFLLLLIMYDHYLERNEWWRLRLLLYKQLAFSILLLSKFVWDNALLYFFLCLLCNCWLINTLLKRALDLTNKISFMQLWFIIIAFTCCLLKFIWWKKYYTLLYCSSFYSGSQVVLVKFQIVLFQLIKIYQKKLYYIILYTV